MVAHSCQPARQAPACVTCHQDAPPSAVRHSPRYPCRCCRQLLRLMAPPDLGQGPGRAAEGVGGDDFGASSHVLLVHRAHQVGLLRICQGSGEEQLVVAQPRHQLLHPHGLQPVASATVQQQDVCGRWHRNRQGFGKRIATNAFKIVVGGGALLCCARSGTEAPVESSPAAPSLTSSKNQHHSHIPSSPRSQRRWGGRAALTRLPHWTGMGAFLTHKQDPGSVGFALWGCREE